MYIFLDKNTPSYILLYSHNIIHNSVKNPFYFDVGIKNNKLFTKALYNVLNDLAPAIKILRRDNINLFYY